jgi:Uncharacterized conserved protein (DUF2190)
MSDGNVLLAKSYTANTAIARRRFVEFDGVSGRVKQADVATDKIIGVSQDIDIVAGERIDLSMIGIGVVEAGGNIAHGDWLTCDAQGRAVAAAVGNTVFGKALSAASAGDHFNTLLGTVGFKLA